MWECTACSHQVQAKTSCSRHYWNAHPNLCWGQRSGPNRVRWVGVGPPLAVAPSPAQQAPPPPVAPVVAGPVAPLPVLPPVVAPAPSTSPPPLAPVGAQAPSTPPSEYPPLLSPPSSPMRTTMGGALAHDVFPDSFGAPARPETRITPLAIEAAYQTLTQPRASQSDAGNRQPSESVKTPLRRQAKKAVNPRRARTAISPSQNHLFLLSLDRFPRTTRHELLRRSRLGNVNAKLSIWDAKTNSYIPGIELERRELVRKAALNNPKHTSSTLNLADENTHPLDDEDDKQDDEADDLLDADGLPEKRRKTTSGSNERIIEVKKWVQVPLAVAEKMPEPKYLADRRPGMESLYKGAYKATNGFGTLGDMVAAAMSGGNAGYDLGEAPGTLAGGTGSANANGGLGQAQGDGASTPVRKNIPPRRKKKGGPGRRPKNWKPPTDPNATPTTENTTTENTTGVTTGDGGDTTMKDTPAASGERIDTTNSGPAMQSEANTQDGEGDGEGEGEGSSESEGEGSEEGEIAPANDVPETETQAEVAVEPVVDEPERAPEKQEEVMEVVEEVVASVDAAPVEMPVVETKEDVAANVEMDVLGALEAALDKEAGESV